jgi:hypothetical protein
MNSPDPARHEPDASDVVTGPIGAARLRDPSSADVERTGEGADLDKLEPPPSLDEATGSDDEV